MAEFTRKALKAIFSAAEIEVPKDVIGQLCDLHTDSVEDTGDTIRELNKKLKAAEEERDELKNKVPKEGEETVTKASYDQLKSDFDTYKQGVEEKETKAKKSAAVRELLKGAGVSEKRLDSVLRVYDMTGVELDKDGKVKDAEERTKAIKTDWADFITTERQDGAQIDNPPAGGGGEDDMGSLSMADYIARRNKK